MFSKKFSVLTLLILGVTISAYVYICIYFNKTENQIFQSYVNKLTDEYNFTLDIYTKTADLLFINDINTDEIKQILKKAFDSNTPEEKNIYRTQLLDHLNNFYSNIKNYDFRQLHFHEADNTSFLRFHKPEKYGDNLTGIRSSVEYVNKNRKSISGFEEGRIFNGYRNVYPLFIDTEYLGSVELSISMGAVMHQLEQRLHQNSQFIIKKSIVYQKVFDDELVNYKEWNINDDYMLDLSISEDCVLYGNISDKYIRFIKEGLLNAEKTGLGFSLQIWFDNDKKIIAFMPVRNFDNEIAGFIFSLTDASKVTANKNYYRIISVIFIGLLAFIVFFIFYYIYTDKKIKSMIVYDPLTKIYSRRMIFIKLEEEINRYLRYKNPFCICMIDIDHFKQVNDHYGHLAGDSLLSELSSLLKHNIRISDSVGRYGGDELMIIFPACNEESAAIVMKHIQEKIRDKKFRYVESITISGGIAMSFDSMSNCDDLIELADQNLYKAKQSGRNTVIY